MERMGRKSVYPSDPGFSLAEQTTPLGWKLMDGYVYPPSLGNSAESLQDAILGWDASFEADLLLGGKGVSTSYPATWIKMNWDTRGSAPLSIGGSIGNTTTRPVLDSRPWDYLDGPVVEAVARKPDNGCNCGK